MLVTGLEGKGYTVDVLPVYRTVVATPDPDVVARVQRGDVDAITFTSSSTVTNFVDVVDVPDPQPMVISIGPITTARAAELGLRVDAEADPHTIEGLVAALLGALSK